jgi:hypothetical protein
VGRAAPLGPRPVPSASNRSTSGSGSPDSQTCTDPRLVPWRTSRDGSTPKFERYGSPRSVSAIACKIELFPEPLSPSSADHGQVVLVERVRSR